MNEAQRLRPTAPFPGFLGAASKWHPYLLSVVAGLVLAGAFPPLAMAGLAWIGPALLLAGPLAARDKTFQLGLISGLVYHLASLYWLLYIPFPAGAIAGWLALSAYLALFTATWVWFVLFLLPSSPSPTDFLPGIWPQLRAASSLRLFTWALLGAAAWVASELIQARFLTGFPWNLLGVSQFRLVPLIQMTSITGLYGLSFLIVWFSLALLVALAGFSTRSQRTSSRLQIALPGLAVLFCFVWGAQRLGTTLFGPATSHLKVALIQPSIPQTLIFDPAQNEARFERLLKLTSTALAARPDLMVWPEAAVPGFLRDERIFSRVASLLAGGQTWAIVGADDIEWSGSADNPERVYFNSSFLVNPRGEIVATYRKRRLVIFGEYVPFADFFPILRRLTPIEGEFRSGPGPVPFYLADFAAHISTLICFEDNFSALTREYVDENTDFLLNLTNNGWFGKSAAQWQHAASALFRAVENGVPLVRCTNNGLTCWIDAYGRLHDEYFDGSKDIYGEGVKIIRVPLKSRVQTFYHRHGDWFAWVCLAVTIGAALWRSLGVRKSALVGVDVR